MQLTAQEILVFAAPMGTKGDYLPMLFGAAQLAAEGETVVVMAQPQFQVLTLRELELSTFTPAGAEELALTGQAGVHTYIPPSFPKGSPPVPPSVVTGGGQEIKFIVKNFTFVAEAGSLILWFPSPAQGSCDETYYQTSEPGKTAFKTPTFGEFLSNWQAVFAAFVGTMADSNVTIISNNYDREENTTIWERAMGISPKLSVRIGSMGLADRGRDEKFYALSTVTAPKKLFGKDVGGVGQGTLKRPAAILAARVLPDEVAAFLATPTVVVTMSSLGVMGTVAPFVPEDVRALFVGSSAEVTCANHLHFPDDLNLEAAFAAAGAIIHGCGVGTSHQAAASGKPCICIPCIIEQVENAKALQALGIAKTWEFTVFEKKDVLAIAEFQVEVRRLQEFAKLSVALRSCSQSCAEEDGMGAFVKRCRTLKHASPAARALGA